MLAYSGAERPADANQRGRPAKRRNQPEPRMVTLRLSKVLANTEVEMPCDFIAFTIGPSSV